MTLTDTIRTIADYPKPGIQFPRHLDAVSAMPAPSAGPWTNSSSLMRGRRSTRSPGIEARGFILGGAIAHQLSAGFVPIRKKGKLPYKTVSMAYALEYGNRPDGDPCRRGGEGRKGHPGR